VQRALLEQRADPINDIGLIALKAAVSYKDGILSSYHAGCPTRRFFEWVHSNDQYRSRLSASVD